jgi:hypothetical protein
MRRLINPARHTADHRPTLRYADCCNRSCNRKSMRARLARSHYSNRREAQHRRITLQPEWSPTILIRAQPESDLAARWDLCITWQQYSH